MKMGTKMWLAPKMCRGKVTVRCQYCPHYPELYNESGRKEKPLCYWRHIKKAKKEKDWSWL